MFPLLRKTTIAGLCPLDFLQTIKIIFMKKFLLALLTILLFTACQKEISNDTVSEGIVDTVATKQATITICHYDAVTTTSKTIEVTQNALASHLAHGDLQGSCSAVLTTICDQDWMVKNLDVDHYRNGDPILQVTNPSAWSGLTIGAWCYFDNDPAKGTIYGKLYNWYAVNDPRGLAPQGWHVPNDAEWTKLENCLGGRPIAGGKIKTTGTIEAGTGLWVGPNTGATNSSGFSALPGGVRAGADAGPLDFSSINRGGYWWSSTEFSIHRAWSRFVSFFDTYLVSGHEQNPPMPGFPKLIGMSVRCVRD